MWELISEKKIQSIFWFSLELIFANKPTSNISQELNSVNFTENTIYVSLYFFVWDYKANQKLDFCDSKMVEMTLD